MNEKRFGIRTMLCAVAFCAGVVALVFHAFRLGEQSGYRQGFDAAIDHQLSERDLLRIEYPLGDVIEKAFPHDHADDAVAEVVKLVAEKVKPETWDVVGGYGTLDIKKNQYDEYGLIINNSIPVHLEVSRLLDDLRGAALGIRDRSFVKKLYETRNKTVGAE